MYSGALEVAATRSGDDSSGDDSEAELITPLEAADLLGIGSINTVKRWVRDGRLAGTIRNGRYLVYRRSVDRLMTKPDEELEIQRHRHRVLDVLRNNDNVDILPSDG
mgnify:CR=1 FL=1